MAASSNNNTSVPTIIDIHILFHCPTRLGPDEELRQQIPCDSPSQDLLDSLKFWCSEYRTRNSKLPWHELSMDAEIFFGNEKDVYLNHKLGSGKLRFEHIYDMYRGSQDKATLCIVVDIKKAKDLADDKVLGDDLYRRMNKGEDPVYSYHRIAVETLPSPGPAEGSQHEPIFRALIVRYVKGFPSDMELRETYQRSINGQIIGSPHLGRVVHLHDLLDDNSPLHPEWITKESFLPRYQAWYEEKNVDGFWKEMKNHNADSNSDEDENLPILPTMTFQSLAPKPGASNLSSSSSDDDDGIHIAVRLVNKLSTLIIDKTLSDSIHLPMNILLRIPWTNDSGKSVRKLIYNELRQLAELVRAERLNKIIQKGGWKLELWAMPQCGGKLYRFGDTKRLKMWMDPEMVKEGNRKIYVEGHLVFRKSLEEQEGEG